ncbi:MAG TPA: hypothetical protein VD994_21645, partial [Prosthecobacter sp.]|nr:hypothetical protein [Prosthecobacter sp.]
MKRRRLLLSLTALPVRASGPSDSDLANPYAGIDWDHCDCVHSMSHQHQGQTDASRDLFYEMGYRHFAFSNYYPSAPTYPLPEPWVAKHPDLVSAPNAEHHSFTDSGLHFNALGSLLATGYGSSLGASQRAAAPLLHRFTNLHVFGATRPWLGVYRLDIELTPAPGQTAAPASISIQGATECGLREGFADKGPVNNRSLAAGAHTLYLRTLAPEVEVTLNYEAAALSVTQFRLMQGANRAWRHVFRAALDGEDTEGRRTGGLLHPDGGGITLNHPTKSAADYTTMLDFDPRVLGIEVWNQLTSGFGSNKRFYDSAPGPRLHFYRLWDEILRTGRRCWGFFVKDHNTHGRGRNVLVVPRAGDASPAVREAAALRAYRVGSSFGSVAAVATDASDEPIPPYDHSSFRFSRIVIRRDPAGQPVALEVVVTGNNPQVRPHIQLRFVTDQG